MSLKRLLAGLIGVPLAILLVLFAVANRQGVTIGLDPFAPEAPAVSFTLPLFAIILFSVMLGVLVGGVAAWMRQGKWRKEAKVRRNENARLEAAAERARHDAAQARIALPAPQRHAA